MKSLPERAGSFVGHVLREDWPGDSGSEPSKQELILLIQSRKKGIGAGNTVNDQLTLRRLEGAVNVAREIESMNDRLHLRSLGKKIITVELCRDWDGNLNDGVSRRGGGGEKFRRRCWCHHERDRRTKIKKRRRIRTKKKRREDGLIP